MEEKAYEFCIKNPKWQRNTFWGFLAFGVLGAIVVTVLWLILRFDWGILLAALFIFALFLIIAALGLYVWYKEKFVFKNGTFTYVKVFRKAQSANVEDLARVEITTRGIPLVTFIGKDGQKLLSFRDDGTSFRKNKFMGALMHYDVPVITI